MATNIVNAEITRPTQAAAMTTPISTSPTHTAGADEDCNEANIVENSPIDESDAHLDENTDSESEQISDQLDESSNSDCEKQSESDDFIYQMDMLLRWPSTNVVRAIFRAFFHDEKVGDVHSPMTLNDCFELHSDFKKEFNLVVDSIPNICNIDLMKATVVDLLFYIRFIDNFFPVEFRSCPNLERIRIIRNDNFHKVITKDAETCSCLINILLEVIKEAKIICPKSEYILEIEMELPKIIKACEKNPRCQQDADNLYPYPTSESAEHDTVLIQDAFFCVLKPKYIKDELSKMIRLLYETSLIPWARKTLNVKHISQKTFFETVYVPPILQISDNRYILDSPLDVLELPGNVIVSGESGAGKTTLAHRIIYCWLNGHEVLGKYKYVFYVDLNLHDATDFYEYLRYAMPKFIIGIAPEKLVSYLSEHDILFIIDGFDSMKCLVLKDILLNFHSSKMIIVSPRDSIKTARTVDVRRAYLIVTVMGIQNRECEFLFCDITDISKTKDCALREWLRYVLKQYFQDQVCPLDIILLSISFHMMETENRTLNSLKESLAFTETRTGLYMKIFSLLSALFECDKSSTQICKEFLLNLGEIALHKATSSKSSNLKLSRENKFSLYKKLINIDGETRHKLFSTFLVFLPLNGNPDNNFSLENESKPQQENISIVRTASKETISSSSDNDTPSKTNSSKARRRRKRKKCANVEQFEPQHSETDSNDNDYFSEQRAECTALVQFDDSKEYKFLHTSQIYHLSALYISECLTFKAQSVRPPYCFEIISPLISHVKLDFNKFIWQMILKIKPTVNMTDYHFWMNIVSESIRSNHLCCNVDLRKNIEQKLLELEWILDSKNFSPAIRLMKLFPRINKLTIALTDEPELLETINIIMDFMNSAFEQREVLSISLSIQLNLNHLLSCEWLVRLEPWGSLDFFSGYIDTSALEYLSNCSNLREVKLKISSLTVLTLLKKWHSLEKGFFCIDIDRCNMENIDELDCSYHLNQDVQLEVVVQHLTKTFLPKLIRILRFWLPCSYNLMKVNVTECDLGYEDARFMLEHMNFFSDGELIVKSSYRLSQGERLRLVEDAFKEDDGLYRLPIFKLDWNGVSI